jgi:hypothetical protein
MPHLRRLTVYIIAITALTHRVNYMSFLRNSCFCPSSSPWARILSFLRNSHCFTDSKTPAHLKITDDCHPERSVGSPIQFLASLLPNPERRSSQGQQIFIYLPGLPGFIIQEVPFIPLAFLLTFSWTQHAINN